MWFGSTAVLTLSGRRYWARYTVGVAVSVSLYELCHCMGGVNVNVNVNVTVS